jgi:predicted Zn-dependent peptidase
MRRARDLLPWLALAAAPAALAQGDRGDRVTGLTPAAPGSAIVEERTLGNGLRVIVAARPGLGAAACRLLVKTGLAEDPPGEAGFALYLARLLDKGTQLVGVRDLDKERESRRSVENFEVTYQSFFREAMEQYRRGEGPDPSDPASRPPALQKLRDVLSALEERHGRDLLTGEQRQLYARAGASEAETRVDMDSTVLAATLPATRLEAFFVLESDRARNAVFRDHAATRDQIRREWLARRDADGELRALDMFRMLLWSGHPYGRPAPGADPLDAVTQDALDRERQRRYCASNMAVVVAGDVNPLAVFELADRYFGMLPSGGPREEVPVNPPRPTGPVRMETTAWARATVRLAWAVPGAGNRDAAPLLVAAKVLMLRGAADVAYDAGRLGGVWMATRAATANDDLTKAEEETRAAVETLRTAAVNPDELARARRVAIAEIADALRDVRTMADAIVKAELASSPRDLSEFPRRLAAVSVEDVRRAASQYLADAARATWVQRRARAAPPPAAEPVASKPAPPPAQPPAPVESKPAESRPAESKPAASSPPESRPAESQPAQAPPSQPPPAVKPETSPAAGPASAPAPTPAAPPESLPASHPASAPAGP